MADINLLQNQLKDTTLISSRRTKLVVSVALVLLLVLVGGGVWVYLLTEKISAQTTELSNANSQLQIQLDNQKQDLTDAQAYQAQLANIKTLLANHIAFSPLTEELAKYTYQKAQYASVDIVQTTGKIHIEGTVDSYIGLGKLLLGLSTSPHFNSVKLLGVNQTGSETAGFAFSIDMKVTPEAFIKPL